MRKIIAMIPARMGSTRFPGKPLAMICGKTMIEHVWRRVKLNDKLAEVYIATCDNEIKLEAENFGAQVIMTSDKHPVCTDRISEACSKLVAAGGDFDIVLNIQGDEPMLLPSELDLLIDAFAEDDSISCANMICPLKTKEEIESSNNVKAVLDQNGFVLYFSRLPIPTGESSKHHKQLGLYGLTKELILRFAKMPRTPLEVAESDDMLRFIENGIQVKAVPTESVTYGVDTPVDRDFVEQLMKNDSIFAKYN